MTQSYGQNEIMSLGQNDTSNTNEIITNNDYNNAVAEITKCYEENIGLITPATAELLFDYLKDMNKDLIIQAIKIASIKNKRRMDYIQGILNDWNRKGIRTKWYSIDYKKLDELVDNLTFALHQNDITIRSK